MKKILTMLIALAILLGICLGCGKLSNQKTENTSVKSNSNDASTKVENIKVENKSNASNTPPANKPQTSGDIKKVNFENFTFEIGGQKIRMKDGLQVGACKKGPSEDETWNVSKENVAFGDLDGDGSAEAIISLYANICGGNMGTDDAVLVYTMKDGEIKPLPTFDFVDEGCKEGEKGCDFTRKIGVTTSYDAKEKAVVVKNFFATEDDAECCPSLSRQTWFKWDGLAFAEFKKGQIKKESE